jgi:hypothetical protein
MVLSIRWRVASTQASDIAVRHNHDFRTRPLNRDELRARRLQNAMTRTTINDIVAVGAGTVGLALFAGLILVPAWSAYSRLWERLAATVLSLYVLAVLVGAGVAGALAAVYFWG